MPPRRLTVFFPCHSLGDFPTWLGEGEADDLLVAWTAAWHPRLLAAIGRLPAWASADAPPADADAIIGIVPASAEERCSAYVDATAWAESHWVRGTHGREAIVAAACTAAGATAESSPAVEATAADFHALGLAWLLAELLARRMRSETGLEASGFEALAVDAARAAVAGDEASARSRLAECFAALETARSHYYPVDVWLLDLVLLAATTLGAGLDKELRSPVPQALVATGEVIATMAARNPAALQAVRDRVAVGTLAPVGGRGDERPLDLLTLDGIGRSLDEGMAAWREHVGRCPTTFGQVAGGSSAFLPGLLVRRGFTGAIWNLFDGTPLPDPGAGRILWEGRGGVAIDAVARPPVDARRAGSFMALAETLGDAMDHDHTAVVPFAHHAGTASRWHDDFRRIASWSKAFGEFVTPDDFFRRTAGVGVRVEFAADAYPVTLPVDGRPLREQVTQAVKAIHGEAVRLAAGREPRCRPWNPGVDGGAVASSRSRSLMRALGRVIGRAADDTQLVLDNGLVRARMHEATGGLLAVGTPHDVGNRLSQRLALRTTRPAPPAGRPWEDVHERAEHSAMVADAITHVAGTIRSCGRLTAADGTEVGTFVQRVSLAAHLPVVLLDIEIRLVTPLTGPVLESYAACRFAWHENEMPDIVRSLHLEPVVTERWRFTAPHFIEIRPDAGRQGRSSTWLFMGGLPWHVRSGEHMLDAILPADDSDAVACRLAIGVGVERPEDLAIELAADRT